MIAKGTLKGVLIPMYGAVARIRIRQYVPLKDNLRTGRHLKVRADASGHFGPAATQ